MPMSPMNNPNPSLAIRPATLDDLELLLRWRESVLRDVFELPSDTDLTSLMRENRAYYQRALADGTHRACFALMDGDVVGCGGLCLQEEMPSPDNPSGHCAYLMNVYTRPESRGRGVGGAVVAWLVRQARETGACKVALEATPAGRAIYAPQGFVDMPDMMVLEQEENR